MTSALRGLGHLGNAASDAEMRNVMAKAQASSNRVTNTIKDGLSTAALVDPEPISKAILGIAAGVIDMFSPLWTTSYTGLEKISATKFANEAAALWVSNESEFMSAPTCGNQAMALANFDAIWNGMVQACTDLDDAGYACITERARGGKYDAFSVHRDPIANYPGLNCSAIAAGLASGTDPTSSNLSALILPVALIAAAMFID